MCGSRYHIFTSNEIESIAFKGIQIMSDERLVTNATISQLFEY